MSAVNGRGRPPSRPAPPPPDDRLPPQNLEAERGVLGSVLLDPEALHDVAPVLGVEDFWRDDHQTVYRAVRDLYAEGGRVDSVTLAEELAMRGELDRVGGVEFLVSLAGGVPHAANARYYADIVKQKSVTRAVMAKATEILQDGYSNNYTSEQLLERWQAAAMQLSDRTVGDETAIISDAVDDAVARLSRRDGTPSGLTTGWHAFDQMGDGLQGGQLVVLAARPSMGKTALAMNMIDRFAVELRVPTLFFNMEMSKADLGERMLVTRSGVFNTKFKNPTLLNETDFDWVERARTQLRGAKLYVNDVSNRSVMQVSALTRRYHKRHGVRCLVVDYLQLLAPDNDRDGRQEQVAKMSRGLKNLARDLDIPVIALSQLSRAVESREDRKPRMADLRESGAIEQDADMVVLIHRPDYYKDGDRPGQVDLMVAKNRNGPTGTVTLNWSGALYKYSDGVTPDAGGDPGTPY